MRIAAIVSWAVGMLDEHTPDRVVIEEPAGITATARPTGY